MNQHKNCKKHGFMLGKNILIESRGKNKTVYIRCAICHREQNKKYREKNKEKILLFDKKYRLLNKEKINNKRKENQKNNPEKYRMYSKKYYSQQRKLNLIN